MRNQDYSSSKTTEYAILAKEFLSHEGLSFRIQGTKHVI